jgi:Derlin-2/3
VLLCLTGTSKLTKPCSRTSNDLEVGSYYHRSHDYAWQLIFACLGIVVRFLLRVFNLFLTDHILSGLKIINTPLGSFTHSRPLLTCLAYLQASLAPAGAQTSLMGLITVPVAYFPYVMVGLDLIMAGPQAAAQSLGGLLAGHLWWMGVHTPRGWARGFASAPGWMKALVSPGAQDGNRGPAPGVHVVPPSRREQNTGGSSSGHSWGSGRRLGSS